jgi:hypothetical protein
LQKSRHLYFVATSDVSQKCLAARKASSTAPETAVTATILIRFCVATDAIGATWAGAGLVFDFLRFAVCGLIFAPIAFPGDGGSTLACFSSVPSHPSQQASKAGHGAEDHHSGAIGGGRQTPRRLNRIGAQMRYKEA